jgi:RNA recognition motif-containing protein
MAYAFSVENLPPDITVGALKDMFAQIGEVQAVTLKTDHQLHMNAFVEMILDLDTYRAVNCFNGSTIQNRKIRLTELKPEDTRSWIRKNDQN